MRIDYTGIGYLSRERAMVDFNSQSVEKEHTSAREEKKCIMGVAHMMESCSDKTG